MSNFLLSILIPYTEDRIEEFGNLSNEFRRQIDFYKLNSDIEVISDGRGKEIPIGQKRNDLYNESNGLYSVMWDSDDWIDPYGLELICSKLSDRKLDAVGYKEHCLINGVDFVSNISDEYDDWEGDGTTIFPDGFNYHRTIFFKTPILTELCRMVGVDKKCRFGEDHDFARRLKPHLKNVGYIDEYIYRYIHNSKPEDHNKRYGIDRG